MNKGLFSGWRDIFSFTFKQAINAKNFKLTTIGLTVVLFVVGMAISTIMAYGQHKDETEVSPIEVVHVIDESGLAFLYLDGFLAEYGEEYPAIQFLTETAGVEELNAEIVSKIPADVLEDVPEEEALPAQKEVILHIEDVGDEYFMNLYIPENSIIKRGHGKAFLKDAMMVLEQSKLMSSGISMENLSVVMSGISTTILDAGEAEKTIGEELVAMLLPMLCMFFIYMMNLVYGQSIGNIVSVEKTSKLMEMMLTLTRPYGLIFGKIFAMTSIAILQMLIWVGGLVGGFLAGHVVAKEVIYPEYNNILIEAFQLISSQEGSTAFSAGAYGVAIFTVCVSFLFYCVLAGMIASFATKAEDLAQVMSIYQLLMMLGFFGAYLIPIEAGESVKTLLRIFPVTSAYMLPGDLVVGNVTVGQGILYMMVLVVTTVVLVIISGKVYKNQLFYKGTKLMDRLKKKKN